MPGRSFKYKYVARLQSSTQRHNSAKHTGTQQPQQYRLEWNIAQRKAHARTGA